MLAGGKSTHDFWIISVPRKILPNTGSVADRCRSCLKSNIAEMKFPKGFRPGTVDDMYGLSDDLIKMDSFVESVTIKISKQLKDLVNETTREEGDKGATLVVGNAKLESFMRDFDWNTAKYKTTTSLREIVESINQEVSQLDEELRNSQSEYIGLSHAIDSYERNKTGNLQIRDLADLVKAADVIDSEHLTTLFVIIPKHSEKDWETSYETLTEWVVPRSSRVVFQDGDTTLRSVVLFKSQVDEYKTKLLKKKWTVREFTQSTGESSEDKAGKIDDQREKKKKAQLYLTRWCKLNFGESFSAWVHLKAIRVYVEANLRFGLPRDYVFMVLEPDMKKEKQLRKILAECFPSLASEYMSGDTGDVAIAGTQEEFYPYVFSPISI